MFTPSTSADSKLLELIASNISSKDVRTFERDEVFRYSHVIPATKILEPLVIHVFSAEELSKYQFVISEIGGLWGLSKYAYWFQLYLSTLYIFAESNENINGDDLAYYFRILEMLADKDDHMLTVVYANFLERLYERVDWSAHGRDYWILLTWLYCRRLSAYLDERQFTLAYNSLLAEHRKQELNRRLGYGDVNTDAWLRLEERLPILHGIQHDDFRLILLGSKAALS